MKNLISQFLAVLVIICLTTSSTLAQRSHSRSDLDSLYKYELKLIAIGDSMLDGSNQMVRVKSLLKFIPLLVKTLKIPGSFDYPFDSLRFMYTFTPPDRRFRLYNWNLQFGNGSFRYYGVIQMKNEDSLQLIPLYDQVSDFLVNAEDTVLKSEDWMGAQYYQLIQKGEKNKRYYVLLGWDGFRYNSTKKVIDVLTINEEGQPRFGAPVFHVDEKVKTRMIFQFRENAIMTLKYLPDKNYIVYDHLVPPNKANKGRYSTYIPDGTYDYLVYKKDKGVWIKEEIYFGPGNSPAEDADEN